MFSADNTNLPGWKIARYYWNFGDETVATGKEVNKTFMKPGTYNVQLIVTAEPRTGGSYPGSMCLQEHRDIAGSMMKKLINKAAQ